MTIIEMKRQREPYEQPLGYESASGLVARAYMRDEAWMRRQRYLRRRRLAKLVATLLCVAALYLLKEVSHG